MNGAQLHLALNHLPVVLSLAGLLVMLWGWISRSPEIKKVGLALVAATAVCALAAFLTGEPAEDALKAFPGFSKSLVHEHEEAGEAALVVSILAGVSALAGAFLQSRKHRHAPRVFVICAGIVLLASLAFFRTAHLGGLIRHEELRPAAVSE
jgi:uncharacterized membrane protein